MFKEAILGGTFNKIHKGHNVLFDTAFKCSDFLIIGLSSDKFANNFKSYKVKSFKERERVLKNFLEKYNKKFKIIELNDIYGQATTKRDVEAIIVSEETLARAQEINAIRFKKGLSRLAIVVVPLTLRRNQPLSASRM